MSVADIEAALTQRLGDLSALGAKVKIDFTEDRLLIDGTTKPATLSHEDEDADCTVVISSDNLSAVLDGKLDPNMAFMTGKLKVKGSTALALKLAGILKE